jgi:flagellar protein FliL
VKKILIIFTVFLMLSGGSLSVMKWLAIGPFEVAEEAPKVEEVDLMEPPKFIEMSPLTIPIFRGDNIAASIQIQLQIEVIGRDNEETVRNRRPRLGDAFLRDLHGFLPRLIKDKERLDLPILKKRLLMVASRVTGPGVVNDILIESVTETK